MAVRGLVCEVEAAQICGVSRQYIDQLVKRGQFLPSMKIGKTKVWDETDVMNWYAERRAKWFEAREERKKELAQRPLNRTRRGLLSPRETEILTLASQGVKSKEIAEKLGIVESTMRHTAVRAYKKLSVNNIEDAIIRAIDLGIIKEENNDDN